MTMSSAPRLEKAFPPFSDRDAPIIDLVHLSRQTLSDGALESELLRLFVVQAQQYSAWLGETFAPGEAVKQADLTHRLKGSARAIGAFPLAEAADSYEGRSAPALGTWPAKDAASRRLWSRRNTRRDNCSNPLRTARSGNISDRARYRRPFARGERARSPRRAEAGPRLF